MQQPALAPAPHPMQNTAQDNAAEQSLREHLLAQVHSPPQPVSAHHLESIQPSSSASPHNQNIDPAIAGSSLNNMSTSDHSGGDDDNQDSDDKKGGKRELSTSKRAAQNRAAQRAFRQRKEQYIKKLEDQVRDYNDLNDNYKATLAENYQLRDYIINLQSRLIESQGEYPQPPSNIELNHPRPVDSSHQVAAPTAPMGPSAASQLQASAAQAVADLGNGKHQHEEAAYLDNELPSKRFKPGTDTEMSIGLDPTPPIPKPAVNGSPVVAQ
ncbi:MAG: hypothetical protein M1827_005973 [Pycnora praestabilis]|nr:MAG: hypothetical protein M1827_005973 [Pycnora praestabilis]